MEIEALGAVPAPRRPLQPIGVTAEIAETRTRVREIAPSGKWEAVMAEVARLQAEEGRSPLAALQAVYDRLASGWSPR